MRTLPDPRPTDAARPESKSVGVVEAARCGSDVDPSAEGGDRAGLDQIGVARCPSPFQVLWGAVVSLSAESELSDREDLILGDGATIAFAVVQRLLDVSAVRAAYDLELLPTLTDRDQCRPALSRM